MIPFNSYHDSTVARHWEPHVVSDGILGIAIKIQKLFISVAPFLCEDLHMLTYIVSIAAFYCCIDQNLLCCGWYRVGDVSCMKMLMGFSNWYSQDLLLLQMSRAELQEVWL